jgi:hypothetical protein
MLTGRCQLGQVKLAGFIQQSVARTLAQHEKFIELWEKIIWLQERLPPLTDFAFMDSPGGASELNQHFFIKKLEASRFYVELLPRWERLVDAHSEIFEEGPLGDTGTRGECEKDFEKAVRYYKGNQLQAAVAACKNSSLHKLALFLDSEIDAELTEKFYHKANKVLRLAKTKAAPAWLSISKTARLLGIDRNTVAAWHKPPGWVVVPGKTKPEKVLMQKRMGKVNFAAVRQVRDARRAAPTAGRGLGHSLEGGEVIAYAIGQDKKKASEGARAAKVVSLLQGVGNPDILRYVRKFITKQLANRAKIKHTQSKTHKTVPLAVAEFQSNPLRGWHGGMGPRIPGMDIDKTF